MRSLLLDVFPCASTRSLLQLWLDVFFGKGSSNSSLFAGYGRCVDTCDAKLKVWLRYDDTIAAL